MFRFYPRKEKKDHENGAVLPGTAWVSRGRHIVRIFISYDDQCDPFLTNRVGERFIFYENSTVFHHRSIVR